MISSYLAMFDPMTLDPGVPLNYDKVRILLHLFKEPDASSGIKLTDKLPQTLGLSPSCNLLSEPKLSGRLLLGPALGGRTGSFDLFWCLILPVLTTLS